MRIKIKHGDGRVSVIDDADLMIVEDRHENPVSIACRYGGFDDFCVSCIDNETEFNQVLRNLHIHKTVVKVNVANSLKRPEALPLIAGD